MYKLVFNAPPLLEEGVAAWGEMSGVDYACDYGDGRKDVRYSLLLPESMDTKTAANALAGFLKTWTEHSGIDFILPNFRIRPVRSDWERAWKRHFRGRNVGERFYIGPPGEDAPLNDRLCIRIDPGPCFGTGHHPTTTLCLDYLEGHSLSGLSVLEPGCGSGVLSIAAVLLGAERAVGFDIDHEAIGIAMANAARNGVGDRTAFQPGTLDGVDPFGFDLVLLNMLPVHFLPHLDLYYESFLAPEGKIYFSGIHQEQRALVLKRIPQAGFTIIDAFRTGEWCGILCCL